MFNRARLNFLFRVILFSLVSTILKAQSGISPALIPSLQRILINGDSVISIQADSKKSGLTAVKLILEYRNNNIIFEYPSDDNSDYRFFLKGYDREWTPRKKNSFKEYTNLPAGIYTFHAEFRGPDGIEIEAVPLTFKVLPLWYASWVAIIIYLSFLLLIIWVLYDHLNLRFARKQFLLEQIINKRTEDLITEKEKTEALLSNVLPKNTAEEIMTKGKATKIKYNFVTVLFSDIQGFTRIAEEMKPEFLIDELDKFFFHFDSVMEKYGIEKIKTIGDAYMCAGGIPEKNRTNPVEVILAALEMKSYMKGLKETTDLDGMNFWDIRIGIHTGTVVAGVVGQKKLSYDIWGDTVNTASRMESSGEAGKINISGTTYEFVKDFFTCEYRGKMPVKYKGELEMYFVNGIIPDLCDETGGPNRRFVIKMQLIKLKDIEEMVSKMFDDEAPPNLYFHNSAFAKNISTRVEQISAAENLSEEEFINLKLASVFLLTGYITDYEKPMEAASRLVEEILPRYGFNNENIESAKRIIKNSFTDHPESAADNILHDARFDYLGRSDYFRLTEKLLREISEYGKQVEKKSWIEVQEKYLYDHDFKTGSARLLRSIPMEVQIARLRVYGE